MQWESPTAIFAAQALTAQGWQRDVLVSIEGGKVANIAAASAAPAGALHTDLLLPGMSDLHSHAFQRAMAGLTETPSASGKSNFWSWREVMYGFAAKLNPEQLEAIAQHLYIELLKQGYTAVGEFHYLHHDANGKAYANPAELSLRVITAAKHSGIHLTHLPVMYETANFGGVKAGDEQKRFTHNVDAYLKLLEILTQQPGITLGIAPHSLRAVTPQSLQQMLAALPGLGLGNCPIHIHAAEQEKEVEECLAATGARPVQWLLDHANIDARWCLVHATHMNMDETKRLAASGSVAGLCPTTEANLGDGIFPAADYRGAFGIGSDSNICVNPFEELRLLEYGQRLQHRQRNLLARGHSTGRSLYEQSARGGAQALGLGGGAIEIGARADLIGICTQTPLLADKTGDTLLDTLVFAHPHPPIRDVFVSGAHVVKQGRHAQEGESAQKFMATLKALRG